MAKDKINNLILELNYTCNNNCVYCYLPHELRKERARDSNKYFMQKLKHYMKKGVTSVDFTGGEPTLYKDLDKIVDFARKTGYKNLTLVTNGRRLTYKKYLKHLVKSGINRVVLPLDGPDAGTAEAVTRAPGSFSQTIKAANNIKSLHLELGLTVVINKLNYKKTPEIIKKCIELGADFINIQFLLPYVKDKNVACCKISGKLIPEYRESTKYVKKCLDLYGNRIKINVHFVPFCYMKGYEGYIDNEAVKFDRQVVNYKGFEYNVGLHLQKGSAKTKKCLFCPYENRCPGYFVSYFNELGIKAFDKHITKIDSFAATNEERIAHINNILKFIDMSDVSKMAFGVVLRNRTLRFQQIDFCIGAEKQKDSFKMSVSEAFDSDDFRKDLIEVSKILKADTQLAEKLVKISQKKEVNLIYSIREEPEPALKVYFNLSKVPDAASFLKETIQSLNLPVKIETPQKSNIKLVGFNAGREHGVTVYYSFDDIDKINIKKNKEVQEFKSLFRDLHSMEFMISHKIYRGMKTTKKKLYALPRSDVSSAKLKKEILNLKDLSENVKNFLSMNQDSSIASFALCLDNFKKEVYIVP